MQNGLETSPDRTSLTQQFTESLGLVLAQKELDIISETRFQETCELVAGSANHEAKALTLLAIWDKGIYLSRASLGSEIADRQGPNVSWLPDSNLLFNFCNLSLEPIGAVVEGNIPSKSGAGSVTAFKVSDRGKEIGIPIAGLILDWSLRHPEISVRQVLGATHTRSARRAPETRLNIFMDLLTNPNIEQGLGVDEILGLSPVRTRTLQPNVEALEDHGLIVKESLNRVNDKLYKVMHNTHQSDRQIENKTQVVYDFLETLESGQTFTHQELLDYCVSKFSKLGLESDPSKARTWLSSATQSGNGRFPEIERLGPYNNGRLTRVRVLGKYSVAITELCNIILAINDNNPSTLFKGKKLAASIVANKALFSQLMQKAYEFSPRVRASTGQTQSNLLRIFASFQEPLSFEVVYSIYKDGDNPPLSMKAIISHLNRMANNGLLTKSQDRKVQTSKKQINFYSIRPTE